MKEISLAKKQWETDTTYYMDIELYAGAIPIVF